jgi:hypothetical protein
VAGVISFIVLALSPNPNAAAYSTAARQRTLRRETCRS